jgi:hypothetical protein
MATTIAREPLVHFLVLGALLFLLYRPAPRAGAADGRIVVSAGRVEQIATVFAKTWMRAPTTEELRGLIREHVLEEVAYREALAMGLDRDDPIIRRRLKQKLDFLTEDEADLLEPGSDVLAAFLGAHAESFREPPRSTFEQVFASRDRRGEETEAVARRWLAALESGETVDGDPTLLPLTLERATPAQIDARFGAGFAAELDELPVERWALLSSTFGTHLVRVSQRLPGRLPGLDEIRPDVEREWSSAQRQERRARREAEMLERFDIVVEWPRATVGTE